MGDWDFLYEMNERGYSAEEIADAAASGAAPWEWAVIDSDWIESQLERQPIETADAIQPVQSFRSRAGFPFDLGEQARILQEMVGCAKRHFENSGRYLQIWGELGELYAEVKFGLRRHGSHKAGSDGTIAGQRVEVKTISPEKSGDKVLVKRQGDFEKLLIVRIDERFQFRAKLFDRGELGGANGKFLWGRLKRDEGEDA